MITFEDELELASDLASRKVLDIAREKSNIDLTEEDLLEFSTDGVTYCYKEEYQDLYNEWHDYYVDALKDKETIE